MIGKLRKDANLRYLYHGKQNARGRKRLYSAKFDINNLQALEFVGIEEDNGKEIQLYTAIVKSISLEQNIRIVLVRQAISANKYRQAILFSTDTASKIYQYYSTRFQIEFSIRDAKQFAGLSDCQARYKESLHFHFNASFMALNLIKIQDRQEASAMSKTIPFSMASWKVRFHNETLIRSFFSIFGLNLLEFKSHPAYNQALSLGSIHG